MSTTPNTPAPSVHLPAQVTLASEHVTGSYAAATARASLASPSRRCPATASPPTAAPPCQPAAPSTPTSCTP